MNRIARRVGGAIVASALLVVAPACTSEPPISGRPSSGSSEESSAGGGGTPTTAASTPTAQDAWLAGMRVEHDPDALDADTQALKDVLGGALIVSPTTCFEGLPADVDAQAYVLGIQAPTRAEVDGLVAQTGRDPLFETRVRVLCTD